ncbi:MAG: hypothetical protein EBR87_05155 [Cytophagia bacterium]|nr:hypothetical protein [Cytophagia bacterium]
MKAEENHLADLFQYDEIYWVPADRESNEIQLMSPNQIIDSSNQVQHSSSLPKENVAGRVATNLPEPIEHSFESEPSLDGESSKSKFSISTPWVVVGNISELEKARLTLIFSAPPMLLSAKDWSIYEPKDDELTLSEFVKQAGANKFIFLGQQPAIWQSDFHVTELVQLESKSVYFFPRLISTLTDTEKSLKLVFWNALKSMI